MNKTLLIASILLLFGCGSGDGNKLTIATAANMQQAMEEIAQAFETETGISVDVSSSSSGTLTNQIKQGAPFDLFVSANMRYPNKLFEEGLAVDPPEVYAYGTLVLCSSTMSEIFGIEELLIDEITTIAIPNPETAPYGIAATEAITNFGIDESIKHKIIYGESVGQVNQYIMTGNADIGFTSASVMQAEPGSEHVLVVPVDPSLYTPIEQGIVRLKYGVEEHPANTELFYLFMFSETAQQILLKYDYTLKEGV